MSWEIQSANGLDGVWNVKGEAASRCVPFASDAALILSRPKLQPGDSNSVLISSVADETLGFYWKIITRISGSSLRLCQSLPSNYTLVNFLKWAESREVDFFSPPLLPWAEIAVLGNIKVSIFWRNSSWCSFYRGERYDYMTTGLHDTIHHSFIRIMPFLLLFVLLFMLHRLCSFTSFFFFPCGGGLERQRLHWPACGRKGRYRIKPEKWYLHCH